MYHLQRLSQLHHKEDEIAATQQVVLEHLANQQEQAESLRIFRDLRVKQLGCMGIVIKQIQNSL